MEYTVKGINDSSFLKPQMFDYDPTESVSEFTEQVADVSQQDEEIKLEEDSPDVIER